MCIKETFNKYSYLSEPFYFDQSKLMTLYNQVRFIFYQLQVTSEPFQCRREDPLDEWNSR